MNEHDLAELAQTLFEESGDALFLFDPDSELLIDVNPMAQRLAGWTRQELLRFKVDFLFRSEQQGGLQRLRQAYRKTGPFHAQGGFLLRHRKDGVWVPVNLTVARLHSEARTVGLITARDVTEEVRRRDQLQASEARCRSLLENLEQSVFLKDAELRFVAVNRQFCEGVHLTEPEILGKTDFDLYPDELAEKYRADDQGVLGDGRRLETEEQTLIEGRLRWVRVIKTPVRDRDERPVGVLCIFWDVTEQRALEEQLRQAARMEAVGQLAGGVAHDFNNLLTAILGNLSLMRLHLHDGARSAVAGLIDGAEQASWRAAALTKQLLGFSRRTVLHVEPVDANRTLDEVQGLLLPTIDPRIRLEVHPQGDLWPVLADPGQLCQVLLNLAINARDAVTEALDDDRSLRATVWVRLEAENVTLTQADSVARPHVRAGDFVRLRVADNGMGIPDDVLPRIFEPFFTTKGPDRGTGLGLAMVFGIVQQHKGWIECRSEPGRGTAFDIYLPRGERAEAGQVSARPSTGRGRGVVLLVDDEPMLLNLGRAVLQQAGFQVLLAGDGEQAVEEYRQRHSSIDLVVLDRTMPRLSGRDALRQMRQIRADAPVLIASGYAAEQLSDEEREGVLGFLAKPYSPDDLVQAVRAAIEKARGREAARP